MVHKVCQTLKFYSTSLIKARANQYIQNTADVELINREIRIEAGEDICDSTAEGGGSSSHPSRKRAAPPSCAPFYQGDPGQASNAADIPQWTGCDTHLGFEYASTDSIKAAMTQGIKYLLSPVQGPQRPGQGPWQIATRAMYPHAYGNSDDISFTSDCENAVAGYTDLIEFPIMPDGSVLEAGKNAGRGGVPNVGVQRVVFKAKAERDPFAADWNYIFCGVMSHFTTEKVKVVIGDDERWVLPFKLCPATCASHAVGECSWLWN